MKMNLKRSPIPIHLIKVFLGTSFSITLHLAFSPYPTFSIILPKITLHSKKKRRISLKTSPPDYLKRRFASGQRPWYAEEGNILRDKSIYNSERQEKGERK